VQVQIIATKKKEIKMNNNDNTARKHHSLQRKKSLSE
jgi:hypothetical protein